MQRAIPPLQLSLFPASSLREWSVALANAGACDCVAIASTHMVAMAALLRVRMPQYKSIGFLKPQWACQRVLQLLRQESQVKFPIPRESRLALFHDWDISEVNWPDVTRNVGYVGVSSMQVSLSLHIDRNFLTKIGILRIVSVITQ